MSKCFSSLLEGFLLSEIQMIAQFLIIAQVHKAKMLHLRYSLNTSLKVSQYFQPKSMQPSGTLAKLTILLCHSYKTNYRLGTGYNLNFCKQSLTHEIESHNTAI